MDTHIFSPSHLEFLPRLAIRALHDEGMRKNVGQFSAITIPASNNLLLVIIVVASRKQMPKNKLRNINLLLFVNLNGDPLSIVVDSHIALGGVDVDPDNIHPLIPLVVVSSVDKHLVEYFIKGGHVLDLLIGELDAFFPQDPLV